MDAPSALAAFGSTGRIGLLYPGAQLRQVAAAYGMPWDIGRIHKRHRWPHLCSYGEIEFAACRCRIVTALTVQTWREAMAWPAPTQSGQNIAMPARPTFTQIVDALAAADCPWERLEPSTGQCTLRTLLQRVDFTFATDVGTEPVRQGPVCGRSTTTASRPQPSPQPSPTTFRPSTCTACGLET